ncbi:coenzyme Q binding COQ10 A [Brachionus plicatilis]|uniref:Coenzyme Q binding COQ10 A n=1 Tax=Brachionus plicatilis TaxID=10195 RepID=A0A3M7SJQ2_BRAPC|nr:coenzyme Q binding COQ10 A [Brachionus plicatilis]
MTVKKCAKLLRPYENKFFLIKRNEASKSVNLIYQQPLSQKEEPSPFGKFTFKPGKSILKSTSKGSFYHEKVILGYSREQMCDLVFDVRQYKEFLPFCIDSEIIEERSLRPRGINLKKLHTSSKKMEAKKAIDLPSSFKAKLEIGYPPIREAYISHVSMVRPETVKSISRDTNLFEYLINEWKFHPYRPASDSDINPNCCIVEFYVSFNFRSVIYNKFSSLVMDQIYKQMLGAFVKRAHVLYGKASIEPKNLS